MSLLGEDRLAVVVQGRVNACVMLDLAVVQLEQEQVLIVVLLLLMKFLLIAYLSQFVLVKRTFLVVRFLFVKKSYN